MKGQKNLSRRERQIMDVIYELQEATVSQVLERLPRPPSYSAVRALLRVLEHSACWNKKATSPIARTGPAIFTPRPGRRKGPGAAP